MALGEAEEPLLGLLLHPDLPHGAMPRGVSLLVPCHCLGRG